MLVALRSVTLDELPLGAVVGTSSPRRRALVLAARPDLSVEPIRGNVDTRLRKLAAGDFEAALLAAAGLRRLGLAPAHCTPLDPERFVPGVGQGIIAVEARLDDRATLARLAQLDHAPTRVCAEAERAYLAGLGASCTTPVAAHAHLDGATLRMSSIVAADDGQCILRSSAAAPAADSEVLGRRLAEELLAKRAASITALNPPEVERRRQPSRSIMARVEPTDERPLDGRTIVVTRAAAQARRFLQLLEAGGARVLEAPAIVIAPPPSWERLDSALAALETFTWVIFTSVNGVAMVDRRLAERGLTWAATSGRRVAAIGPATADALAEQGVRSDVSRASIAPRDSWSGCARS